jgi:hypothetical protein
MGLKSFNNNIALSSSTQSQTLAKMSGGNREHNEAQDDCF